ncbi:MAG: HNH endonuclease [Flavobacteriales bacterium]|nr:HNH endonuclease [Flavobacteriales bacterium]
MPYCLYCGKTKESSAFTSREHVIPKTLDGNFNGRNPFIISTVCNTCNHTAGEYVDLPFAKSWYLSNDKADSYTQYYPITATTKIPLRYMGELSNIEFQGYVCEFWFGPAGDTIYHFHKPHPKPIAKLGVSRMKIHQKKIDPGFVFLFFSSDNPEWQRVTFNSTRSHFRDIDIHAPQVQNERDMMLFRQIPRERLLLSEKLWAMIGQQHSIDTIIDLVAEQRFMCKLALGLGDLFLKPSFAQSEQAALLRCGMWERNLQKAESLDIRGIGFFDTRNADNQLHNMLSWPYGHVIGLVAIPNAGVMLYSTFYGVHNSTTWLSLDQEHWKPELGHGIFYLMVPYQKTCIGPFRYEDYLFHNTGVRRIPEIEKLEEKLEAVVQPPKRIAIR